MKIPPPQSNTLKLKKLDASSQAGRVVYPGQTRGQKSDRLQLVAQIAPLGNAAQYNWSATGVSIADNGRVFVSWHSNRQATEEATRWGGAVDEIDVPALANREGNAMVATYSLDDYKFNNVVAYGSNLYFPLTSHASGAAVGRMVIGDNQMTVLSIPGVSANAIAFNNNDLRVVTGYKGGVFELPRTADWIAEGDNATEVTPLVEYNENFGGKYIVGNLVLRTDASEATIENLAENSSISLGAPLKSNDKYAESYDPETGWTLGDATAPYYGKHTMAIADGYIYVGGGIGEGGQNGLRVYDMSGNLKWQNGTTTTAVTVAGDYVFAATDAGLRVYNKYQEGKDLELFAFQVLNYDENGNAANGASGHPEAGINANSCNYVAVSDEYIYLAAGQQGVFVFKLDETVTIDASLSIPTIDYVEKGVIESGEDKTEFVVPTTVPEVKDDEDFLGWATTPDATEPEYNGGDKVPATSEKPHVTLYPVVKKFVMYTLNFNGWEGKESEIENVPVAIEQKNNNTFKIPENVPVWGERNFCGWYIEAGYKDFEDPTLLKPGAEFTLPADVKEFTLYGVWSSNMSGGTGEEKPVTPTPPVIGGEDSNGKG